MKLAVFDCDGTLVDSSAHIVASMEQAFDLAGCPSPDPNLVRRMVGLSLPIAVRQIAPDIAEEQARAVVDAYKTIFRARRENGLLEEPLYDGMAELLHRLHNAGWALAVATGKSDRGLEACLAAHGLTGLFTSLQTADRHPSKPHPAMLEAALFEAGAVPSDAVMIGDTTFDIHMAIAANVRAVGVAWGYHGPDELREAGAAAVAQRVADLEHLL